MGEQSWQAMPVCSRLPRAQQLPDPDRPLGERQPAGEGLHPAEKPAAAHPNLFQSKPLRAEHRETQKECHRSPGRVSEVALIQKGPESPPGAPCQADMLFGFPAAARTAQPALHQGLGDVGVCFHKGPWGDLGGITDRTRCQCICWLLDTSLFPFGSFFSLCFPHLCRGGACGTLL